MDLITKLQQFESHITCISRNVEQIDNGDGGVELRLIRSGYQDLAEFQDAVQGIDVIYHLASQTSTYVAERDPLADYEANVRPMQLLLEACRITNTHPIVIFSGTSTQCGMPESLPVDDKLADRPITVYDFHKLQAERWLLFFSNQGLVDGVSFRLTNVYGPGPGSSSADRGILNLMIKKALNGGDLTLYGEGNHIRDYIYVDDVVRVFLNAPAQITDLKGRHCILGSGEGTKIRDAISMVAKTVAQKTGITASVKKVEPPTGLLRIECRNFVADTRFLQKRGLIEAPLKLSVGIKHSVDFHKRGAHFDR